MDMCRMYTGWCDLGELLRACGAYGTLAGHSRTSQYHADCIASHNVGRKGTAETKNM